MNASKTLHPSMMYPREIHSAHKSSPVCPACKSNRIRLISLSPERAFKRQSSCVDCGTVWGSRNPKLALQYEQRFYQ